MDRREMFAALGAAAAGATFFSGAEAAAGNADEKQDKALVDCGCKCVEACSNCMNWCNESFLACFRKASGGKAEFSKVAEHFNDCGEICGTTAKLVARMSPFTRHTCRACVASCDECAAACEKLADETLKEAVASLRSCSESCREMLKMVGEKG